MIKGQIHLKIKKNPLNLRFKGFFRIKLLDFYISLKIECISLFLSLMLSSREIMVSVL